MHGFHARKAARAKITTAFVTAPEPRTIGVVARGRQLIAGNFLFSGLRVEGPRRSIWDIATKSPTVDGEIQSFIWLDDLAAVGDENARLRAQTWVFEWIDRYGNGKSAGWTPGITGRRVMRWINHGLFLLRGQDEAQTHIFFQSLARQTLFLSKRWKVTAPGIGRFEAIAGTIHAGLTLKGMDHHVDQAVAALAQDCSTHIDGDGAIATRNPEELLAVLSLLNWTIQVLVDSGHSVPAQVYDAVERIAPTLRALRHSNGALARFHGGGGGIEGRLDEALARSGVKTLPSASPHMGFARVTGGRTSLIVDAAAPPTGDASADAHASTLGFELTSGRRPIIVNCGSGARFGEDWRRASRATPSHATLALDGISSSHLAPPARLMSGDELLSDGPSKVHCNFVEDGRRRKLELSHNGYQSSHGLIHARILELSTDGRTLEAKDLLTTLDRYDEVAFDKALEKSGGAGIAFSIRFHLHPDVAAEHDTDTALVSLTLKSGEVWIFRHDGQANLGISPSVYLQNGQLRPRAAQQVVLSGRAIAYATRVRWSLAKAQDTPNVVRDLAEADPLHTID